MKEPPDKKINAIIVDDESLGRDMIRHMAAKHSNLEIVAECPDVKSALEAVSLYRPDLVFLDVEMPSANGFDFVRSLQESERPWIVFITAYSQHAVKAFEARAVDYLQKPFDPERFDEAIERVLEHMQTSKEAAIGRELRGLISTLPRESSKTETSRYLDRIPIKSDGKVHFVPVRDIEYIEAARNYVELHTPGKRHLLYETISQMELQLDPAHFLRIHRSQIVNINCIKELQTHFNGEYIVFMRSGAKLKISRSYKDKVRIALGIDSL